MRSHAPLALLASFLLAAGIQAQSLAEHAAAASGATIGTAAGKPISNALNKIFSKTDNTVTKAAGSKAASRTAPPTGPKSSAAPVAAPTPLANNAGGAKSGDEVVQQHPSRTIRRRNFQPSASSQYQPPAVAEAPPAVQEPPRKEPTSEELASIKVGASERELITTLGQPDSRVTIPDDGHLVEICQYWAKGKPLGTVRLDNGQVTTVQTLRQD